MRNKSIFLEQRIFLAFDFSFPRSSEPFLLLNPKSYGRHPLEEIFSFCSNTRPLPFSKTAAQFIFSAIHKHSRTSLHTRAPSSSSISLSRFSFNGVTVPLPLLFSPEAGHFKATLRHPSLDHFQPHQIDQRCLYISAAWRNSSTVASTDPATGRIETSAVPLRSLPQQPACSRSNSSPPAAAQTRQATQKPPTEQPIWSRSATGEEGRSNGHKKK